MFWLFKKKWLILSILFLFWRRFPFSRDKFFYSLQWVSCNFQELLYRLCYIINFIVHVSSHFLQSSLHCSCFISFTSIHFSLIMFHFYFLQSTVHLIHFIYHSPSCSYLPYLAALILHVHSTLLWVSLFRQPGLWKLTTYECL